MSDMPPIERYRMSEIGDCGRSHPRLIPAPPRVRNRIFSPAREPKISRVNLRGTQAVTAKRHSGPEGYLGSGLLTFPFQDSRDHEPSKAYLKASRMEPNHGGRTAHTLAEVHPHGLSSTYRKNGRIAALEALREADHYQEVTRILSLFNRLRALNRLAWKGQSRLRSMTPRLARN